MADGPEYHGPMISPVDLPCVEDRPAEAPLCPAWLPEEPSKANTDPAAQNREKKRGATTQPTIIGQWYSGTTTQPATRSKAALDLSGTTAQPTDHNEQRIQLSRESGSILVFVPETSADCYWDSWIVSDTYFERLDV
ncbi:hypothetical protein F511_41199 [Dorcoceras hygrometricum]|uniref:Uncharacterized protein n=1 Tax=Dorcoceras hygrometricum TaxID=472368 RepID=A0A2Z7AVZ0_9LAMI|nr:hypothetical protein F511_41199 [Dorcoceras hygrometricum]